MQPRSNPLAESFRYNLWANLRLLEACRGLNDDRLDASVAGTFGSIRRTLLHLVGGEQTFVLRTQGRQHEGELTAADAWPGFDALADSITDTGQALIAIATSLVADDRVVLPYFGKRFVFPRSFFLTHALEHGIEHRTQIIMTMAQLGTETPDLDGWAYAGAMGYGAEEDPSA